MDALDQLAPEAAELLARVDETLARCGADLDHPVWPLLRRVRALPGEVVGALATLRPAQLVAAGSPLRGLAAGYAEASAAVPPATSWRGAGAERFALRWAAMTAHLDTGPDTVTSRLVDTAGYLDAVADWLAEARRTLARTLAEILTSAEAVRVRTGPVGDDWATPVPVDVARACADIAGHVLACVADAHDRGRVLLDRWPARLTELRFHPPVETGPTRFDAEIAVPGLDR